jgi:two-component system, LytTR family, sensor kinase
MLNPILKNRSFTVGYFASWSLVAIVQIIIVIYFYHENFLITVSESLVFNSLFSFIGIGIWYPVYYTDLEKNKIANFLTNHLAASSLAVGLWLWLGYIILTSIFKDNVEYLLKINNSIPSRVGIGFMFYVLLTLNYYLMIYYQNFKEKLVRESELKALVKESELSSLKSQINPHFLFNSLNSISSLTMISPEKAQDMVINLSEFLRYSLSNKKEVLTNFENELTNVERFLKIEKIRFGKRLNVISSIDKNSRSCLLPALILQPIIENAVKYGLYESIDESRIVMESRAFENLLEVKVTNEFDADFLKKKGAGIGLKNVMSRLRIQYGRDDLVKISRTANTFEITLRFPQELNL